MKKVLIVASEFPPRNVGNMLRTVKLVKHLPKLGWKPYILTVSTDSIVRFDYSLMKEIPTSTNVIRAFYPNLFKYLDKRLINKRKLQKGYSSFPRFNQASGLPGSDKESIHKENIRSKHFLSLPKKVIIYSIKFFRNHILIPEELITWLPFAVIEGIRCCKRENINLIYSTVPSYNNHLIALLLKKMTGLPWYADYRDLWFDCPTRRVHSKWRRNIEEILEVRILRNADRINIVSPFWRESMLRRFPFLNGGKISHLTNGYDPCDYYNHKMKSLVSGVKIKIVYTGTVLPGYPTRLLFEALSEILEVNPELRQKVQLSFFGTIHETILCEMLQDIKRLHLDNVIYINGSIHRLKAIEQMKDANALLLMYVGIENRTRNVLGCIPAKLFEYIGAFKPVIGILPEGNVAAEIISKGKLGIIANPKSKPDIKHALKQIIFAKPIDYWNPDNEFRKSFENKKIFKEMVNSWNEIS